MGSVDEKAQSLHPTKSCILWPLGSRFERECNPRLGTEEVFLRKQTRCKQNKEVLLTSESNLGFERDVRQNPHKDGFLLVGSSKQTNKAKKDIEGFWEDYYQSRKCAINNFWTKNSVGLLGWGSRGSRQIIYVRIFPNICSVFGTANRPNINNFRDRQPA